jgi:hypothetical protein
MVCFNRSFDHVVNDLLSLMEDMMIWSKILCSLLISNSVRVRLRCRSRPSYPGRGCTCTRGSCAGSRPPATNSSVYGTWLHFRTLGESNLGLDANILHYDKITYWEHYFFYVEMMLVKVSDAAGYDLKAPLDLVAIQIDEEPAVG